MPHTETQAFLQKPLKGDGRLVRPSKITSTGKLIDFIATAPFLHADLSNSPFAPLRDLCAFAFQNSSNANFAWVQHMLHHLAPNGSISLDQSNVGLNSGSIKSRLKVAM